MRPPALAARGRALLVLIAAALCTGACMGRGQLTRQHVPSRVSTAPSAALDASPAGPPFERYITWARTQVATARARAGLKGSDEQALLDGRVPSALDMQIPFELAPSCPAGAGRPQRGILLIHGLISSPFGMRDVAERFRDQCFLVRTILLPGHGTVPGDLLDATYEQWVEASRYGIDSMRAQVTDLYVGGFSTGGALAVYHALQDDERARSIKALVLFSPAIEVSDRWVFLANVHRWLYSWLFPRGAWYGPILDEYDGAAY